MQSLQIFEHQTQDYSLKITENSKFGSLAISIIALNNPICKLVAQIVFQNLHKSSLKTNNSQRDYSKLMMFETSRQLFLLLKNKNNFEVNLQCAYICIKWGITGQNYHKQYSTKILLNREKLSEIEQLKCQNIILRKKIQQYQNKLCHPDSNTNINTNINPTNINKNDNNEMHLQPKVNINLTDIPANKQKNLIELVDSSANQHQKCQENKMLPLQPQKKTKIIKKKQKLNQNQTPTKSERQQPRKRGRKKRQQFLKDAPTKENQDACSQAKSKVKIAFSNGDYYFGEIQNNLYHGHGLYFSSTNGSFEGQWKNGKANGFGVSTDLVGNRHSGHYIQDKRSGHGVDQYVNGEKYQGNFQNDCKDGFGKYVYSNGDYYEGQWKADMYQGKGKEYYLDGGCYEGTWQEDQKHGEGIYTHPNGTKYMQVWIKGSKQQQKMIE